MMLMTYASEKTNQRAYMSVATQLWVLPCVVALLVLPLSTENPWSTYAVLVVLLSHPSSHPLQVGWCSRISGSVRTRTVSAALYNMFVQLQGIIIANVYRDDDKPDYRVLNPLLVQGSSFRAVLFFADFGNLCRTRQYCSCVYRGLQCLFVFGGQAVLHLAEQE